MTSWSETLRRRIQEFEKSQAGSLGRAVSIKIRPVSGCYHREHSPIAYRIIDDHLSRLAQNHPDFVFEGHESGPELLAYVAAGLTLAKSVIDLVTTIIKARREGGRKGDSANAPVEAIVRRMKRDGELREEKIVRFSSSVSIDGHLVERKLLETIKKAIR